MLRCTFRALQLSGQARSFFWSSQLLARRTAPINLEDDGAVDKRYIDRLVVTLQAGKGGSGSASLVQKSNKGTS